MYISVVGVLGLSILDLHWFIAMDLASLPFPADQLSWDKLDDVMKHCKLSKAQACTVLQLVIGNPPVPRFDLSTGFVLRCF